MYCSPFSDSYILGADLCSLNPDAAVQTGEVKFNNEEIGLEPATDQEPERYLIKVRR